VNVRTLLGALHLGALHLGALHPAEQLLVVVVAFGPLIALFWVLKRRRG
jgi:hypothetical protein